MPSNNTAINSRVQRFLYWLPATAGILLGLVASSTDSSRTGLFGILALPADLVASPIGWFADAVILGIFVLLRVRPRRAAITIAVLRVVLSATIGYIWYMEINSSPGFS